MKRTELRRKTPLKRPTKTLKCEECGDTFERRTDWRPRAADGRTLCMPCSRRARMVGREIPALRTGTTVVCSICGATFYRSKSRLSNGSRLCSIACRSEALRRNPPITFGPVDNSGDRNGRYSHGKRIGKNTNKRKVREAVIDRDGDWCLLCGRPPKGLHLHRVRYGSEGGTYDLNNCVQLCFDHHALVHTSKPTWQPLLLAHIAEPGAAALALMRRKIP